MLHHGPEFISSWRRFQHGETIDIEEEHDCYITAASDIYSELISRFQPRWKTDIEVMVGKTNAKANYSTCVGTIYEKGS